MTKIELNEWRPKESPKKEFEDYNKKHEKEDGESPFFPGIPLH